MDRAAARRGRHGGQRRGPASRGSAGEQEAAAPAAGGRSPEGAPRPSPVRSKNAREAKFSRKLQKEIEREEQVRKIKKKMVAWSVSAEPSK